MSAYLSESPSAATPRNKSREGLLTTLLAAAAIATLLSAAAAFAALLYCCSESPRHDAMYEYYESIERITPQQIEDYMFKCDINRDRLIR